MAKKNKPTPVYKTETQLKEEAIAKQAAEAEAEARAHKSELQKKHENYWYHYKWQTIGGAFAVFLLIFFVKDMFFRTMPDATVVVVSQSYFSEEDMKNLTSCLETFATDYNGDGKIVIATDFITLPKAEGGSGEAEIPVPDLTGGEQNMGNAMKLMAILAAGSDPIYLLDEAAYNYIEGSGSDEYKEDDGEPDYIFGEVRVDVNAKALGYEGSNPFEGTRLYLRTTYSDDAYYEYCGQLLEAVDRSWNNVPE